MKIFSPLNDNKMSGDKLGLKIMEMSIWPIKKGLVLKNVASLCLFLLLYMGQGYLKGN